ncbi:hypothetical protein VB776_20645 [Arcicella sp. DC2W]|uniref:Uncharacterized protein n=1 Tax=Arcicella gelida TaxID=2984195 RepID=A0ABU5SA60_9BACT|nr:hypothetical protein [Arcicella sp. DC2W]MEA5405359.1 hypothetical protein [Arcicella sp. DC2W]
MSRNVKLAEEGLKEVAKITISCIFQRNKVFEAVQMNIFKYSINAFLRR